MERPEPEIIRMGNTEVRFLRSRHETANSLDLFEVHCLPGGRMPVPHYHRDWEETVYGLEGATTFTVAGEEVVIGPGDHLFIPRGTAHGFDNRTQGRSAFLTVLTPGTLGPEYFREIAALMAAETPDRRALGEVMAAYGLVPVPQ